MTEGVNFSFEAIDNISAVIKKISANVEKLGDSVADLGDLFADAAQQQQKYGKAAKDTEGTLKKSAKAAADFNKQVGDTSAVKGSTRFLSGYVKTVNTLRAALNKGGAMPANLFPDTQTAVVQIKQLEGELLDLVNTYRTAFGRGELLEETFETEGAVAELEELRQRITDLSTAAATGEGLDFNVEGGSEELQQVVNVLDDINAQASRISFGEQALSQFDELRDKATQASGRIEEIRNELTELGPSARAGNVEAIQQFGLLSQELQQVQSQAKNTGKNLRLALDEFGRQTGRQNTSLQGFGFRQIKLEDIFPSREQQRVKQVQQNIQRAVVESVREGAVKNALNTFLRTDLRLESLDQNVVQLTSHLPRMRYALYDVSNTAGIFGAAILGAVGATVKLNVEFERAFADVIRTTGVAGEAAQGLRRELVSLSQSIPVGFDELAGIATLAGQLNIAEDRVASFTETVAKFAATSDVTVDAAATAFGRLDQLVAGVNGQFEELASAISAVGVNAVATESEIVNISAQIASIANIAGFSAAELVGFSSALASVGTRPELARGTFTRLFTEISQAVGGTKDTLDDFASLAGQSAEQFSQAWGEGRGAEQVVALLEGLQREGKGAELALRELGITSVRDVPTLLKLAQGVDQVKDQLEISKTGFLENTELQRQYSAIASTTAEKLAVLKNSLDALLSTLGSIAGPFSFLIDIAIGFLNALESVLDNPINQFIVGLISVMTALVGIGSLTVSGMARFGASLAGAATAAIELTEAIGLVKVSMDSLNTSSARGTANANKNAAAKRTQASASDQRAAALKRERAAERRTALTTQGHTSTAVASTTAQKTSTAAINASTTATNVKTTALTRLRTSLSATGASVSAFTAKLKAGAAATMRGAQATRLYGAAIRGLKFAGVLAGFLLVTKAIELASDSLGLFQDESENAQTAMDKFNEKFGDASGYLQAVQQDTAEYNKQLSEVRRGLRDTTEGFDTFTASAGDAGEELSDRSKILAIATGQEDLLGGSIDGSTAALERQTFAIGENTRSLIARKVAEDLAAEAAGVTAQDVRMRVASQEFYAEDSPILQQAGIASIFAIAGDPELGDRIKQNGFDIQQFFQAVQEGNTELANSILGDLEPAAEKLRNQLLNQGYAETSEEIIFLNGVVELGADALANYTDTGSELSTAIKQLQIEQSIFGETTEATTQTVEEFRKEMRNLVDDAYAEVNAQRAIEDAVTSLGEAFATQTPEVVANGQEMQAAIKSITDSASNSQEAVDGLSAFYNAIVEGGYLSVDQLEILQGVILETYETAMRSQLELLRDSRENLLSLASRSGSSVMWSSAFTNDLQAVNEQIANTEQSLENIENISLSDIAVDTGRSADFSEQLADGYEEAESAATGAADSASDLADETEKAVRTLDDYAGDLSAVFSRAFDIRYSPTAAIDQITLRWMDLNEEVEEVEKNISDLLATQQSLAADRSLKEYFLSVAEAYDDQLRAGQLRGEIAEIDKELADNADEVADAQKSLSKETKGNSRSAIENRKVLGGLVQNYQSYIEALASSGASQEELREATARAKREFIDQAVELGYQRSDVLDYARAFDDITFAINNVPRDVTIEADANPALTALRELEAQQNRNIDKARELNSAMGAETPRPRRRYDPDPAEPMDLPDFDRTFDEFRVDQVKIAGGQNFGNLLGYDGPTISTTPSYTAEPPNQYSTERSGGFDFGFDFSDIFDDLSFDFQLPIFAKGGFTGRGGKMDPAGLVHRGEYVVPQEYVDQTTGTPNLNYLLEQMGVMATGGSGGDGAASSPGVLMVELSPKDRQILRDSNGDANVVLQVDSREIARATNEGNRQIVAQGGRP